MDGLKPETKQGKLVLVDGNSLLYRAFFALPALTNSQGEPTNAVYGFTVMLLKVLEEERPDMVAACFDLPAPTFRHKEYADYKATRPETPDDLRAQLATAKEVLQALGIPVFEKEGYEADDLIGTLAKRVSDSGEQVLIVTGDLDTLQLVSDRVSVMATKRGITDTVLYDAAAVKERFGLEPSQLVDYRALKGDQTDNIPGVPGIGEKTAARLVAQHGSAERVIERAGELTPPKLAETVRLHAAQIEQAKMLSRIVTDISLDLDLDALRRQEPDQQKLDALFHRLEFRSLLERLSGKRPEAPDVDVAFEGEELAAALQALQPATRLWMHMATGLGDSISPSLLGLALVPEEGKPVFVAVQQAGPSEGLFGQQAAAGLESVRGLLERADIAKSAHDVKQAYVVLKRLGVRLDGAHFDTMIASYLLDPARASHELQDALFQFLQQRAGETNISEAWQSGDLRAAAVEACRRALWVRELEPVMESRMEEHGLTRLFREIELPLARTLGDMELAGVAVDVRPLAALSQQLSKAEEELKQQIYTLAGEEFTIASPKQLQRILFEKLGLPRKKRTKTGYSTDAEVLSELAQQHDIVAKILQYRELSKLRSTYVDALPRLVHEDTGRVHTSFNQTVTATGRLSSSEPNLQNIPVRTELGREMRRAFVAGLPDHVLLSADYSQIELRVLAHISGDENLKAIFLADEDLHTRTACEIFGLAPESVTLEMRRLAKVVNFAIPYGVGPQRLARDMGISHEEAVGYMARYFQRFPGVRAYMDGIVEQARREGFVTTLLGRRRYLPDMNSPVRSTREFAERTAINTPIQGSAADIIKLAMLSVERNLLAANQSAQMILQVHDELVFEVPKDQLRETADIVARDMSQAFPLCVPVKVDAKAGPNWADMEPV